jgi:hypothetical protein
MEHSGTRLRFRQTARQREQAPALQKDTAGGISIVEYGGLPPLSYGVEVPARQRIAKLTRDDFLNAAYSRFAVLLIPSSSRGGSRRTPQSIVKSSTEASDWNANESRSTARPRSPTKKPYRATLKEGVWTVRGTLKTSMGGVALAEISKSDGRITCVSHGK